MKKCIVVILTAVLMAGVNAEVRAQGNGVNGLFLGAGGGALIGQAIGRNTEGTLIGTAVGGMLGYIIGNERDKHGVTRVRSVTYQQPLYRSNYNDIRRTNRRYGYDESTPSYGAVTRCRETEMLATINGRPQRIYGTACLENGNWVMSRQVNIDQTVIIKKDHRWNKARRHHMKHSRHGRYAFGERRYSRARW